MKLLESIKKQKSLLYGVSGFFFGTFVGVICFSLFVPDALTMTLMYKDQKKLVSDLRAGKNVDTSAMWLENAKSMRAKSKDEYISDMININNTVVLMNNRLQLGMYPSTKELRYFGEQAAQERRTEVEILRNIEAEIK